jgi:hypothetical protein
MTVPDSPSFRTSWDLVHPELPAPTAGKVIRSPSLAAGKVITPPAYGGDGEDPDELITRDETGATS